MKFTSSVYTYLSALVIGVLLLIFSNVGNLYRWMVIVIGILFLVPSAILLISSMRGKRDSYGNKPAKPWYIAAMALAGLVFGVWLLVMPGYFIGGAIYTIGAVLILVGLAATVFIATASARVGIKKIFYLMPWLCILGGIIIMFVGPARLGAAVNIIAGILLICYAANGFISIASARIRGHKRQIANN